MKLTVHSSRIVNISAFMCQESCVMTGLHMAGYEYHYLMLESWNLLYEANTLLAGRTLGKIDLSFVYGIKTEGITSDMRELIRLLKDNKMVLLSVYASQLDFFPKYQISLEHAGFKHHIIVCHFDETTNQFVIVDPIAEYIGAISPEQLHAASVEGEKLHLWSMEFPEEPNYPPIKDIMRRASAINFSKIPRHKAAFKYMREDLLNLMRLGTEERNAWIDRNNLAITTIVNMRQKVWQVFSMPVMLASEQVEICKPAVDSIVKNWMSINFLLVKLRRNPFHSELLHSIEQRIQRLENEECRFLKQMYLAFNN